MRIKYLGHASFLITSESGTRIITDPYTPDATLTYSDIRESAEIVTVSHGHSDHNNVAAVRGNPEIVTGTTRSKGIEFRSIPSYHDDAEGTRRGRNTIFCFEVDGVRVCHLGDLGHRLSDKQATGVGEVDILFVPVGGYFTIDAKTATQVCNRISPRVIIPMHWNYKWDIPQVTSVDEFLRGKTSVKRLDTSETDLKPGEFPEGTEIIVLRPAL